LDRDVAVKILLEDHQDRPLFVRRFLSEARIAGRLQHHGIVPIYELGEFDGGRPYLVMKLVRGRNLDQIMRGRSDPAADRRRLLAVCEQICQAIAYAHSQGVIHRDLKPSNVMVGEYGEVRVMDWGLAKELTGVPDAGARSESVDRPPARDEADGEPATRVGSVLGTPAYMPPEQAAGKSDWLDERADVFGLGAILCEILTGSPPYSGRDTAAVLRQAASADQADILARLAGCGADPALVALVTSCIAPSFADRPRDARVVAARLIAYMESDLRQMERDFGRFFDLSPDMFIVAGLDGYFRRVNPKFALILGYRVEELRAVPYITFVHPDDRADTAAAAERLTRGNPVVRFRNRYRDAGGSYRWVEWTAQSIPDEGIIFALVRDVTGECESG
jgi:serine/threonine-protein kinase